MSSNIRVVQFGERAPEDLALRLRELADDVDNGLITALVAAFVEGDGYSFLFGASGRDAIVLATLLQQRNIERMSE